MRSAILIGELRSGERLPSTRNLAEQLRVSRTITVLAYDQLLAEGFVVGRPGSGTYVADGLAANRPKTAMQGLRLSNFGSAAASVAPEIDIARRRRAPLRYDFAYRRAPVEGSPLETWQRILMCHARKATVHAHDYAHPSGSLALREAIAAHLPRSRAVVCDASQIVVVNGSQQGLDMAARVFLQRGDRIVIEDPHYQGARQVFTAARARLHPGPVDHDGLDPTKLPNEARLAFVMPSHQFPTGTILSLARRLALLKWAKQTNAVGSKTTTMESSVTKDSLSNPCRASTPKDESSTSGPFRAPSFRRCGSATSSLPSR
jgi:GntR family transcriptional regulator/MocR family aminotransferase